MEDEFHRGLKSPKHQDRLLVLKMHGVTPEHLKAATRDPHPDVRERALAHHLADKSVFDSALDDPYGLALIHILQKHPDKVNGDWITRAWNHPSADKGVLGPILAALAHTPNVVKLEALGVVPTMKSIDIKDLDLVKEHDDDEGPEEHVRCNPIDVYLNAIRPEHHAKL